MYRHGLQRLKNRTRAGDFVSVTAFSAEFAQVFADKLGFDASNFTEIIQQVSGRAEDMAPEQKERRSRARHILRACQPFLEEALRKESELTGRPFAQQMKELDEALLSRRNSIVDSTIGEALVVESIEQQANGVATPEPQDIEMQEADNELQMEPVINGDTTQHQGAYDRAADGVASVSIVTSSKLDAAANTPPASTNGVNHPSVQEPQDLSHAQGNNANGEPPTPPMSLESQAQHPHPATGAGGIPWYVEQFDPDGTTIYEERWTGQQVLREMSEELSEMDEEELQELGPDDGLTVDSVGDGAVVDMADMPADGGPGGSLRKGAKKSKGKKGGAWGERSFRQRRWK